MDDKLNPIYLAGAEINKFNLTFKIPLFSSPGRSPGRAIVLPPASASVLASVLAVLAVLAKC